QLRGRPHRRRCADHDDQPRGSREGRLPRATRERHRPDHDRDRRPCLAPDDLPPVRPGRPLRPRRGAAGEGRNGDVRRGRPRGPAVPARERDVRSGVRPDDGAGAQPPRDGRARARGGAARVPQRVCRRGGERAAPRRPQGDQSGRRPRRGRTGRPRRGGARRWEVARETEAAVVERDRPQGAMTVMRLHWPLLVVLACGVTGAPAQAADSRLAVRPFELGDVRLLDGPFKAASERNAQYLLRLEPDRLLHNTLKYAGLEPKGERYGGWEARGIAGHTLGHYLTALAQQFAASGDARFRERLDYVVAEMARAQEAYGDGYVGALPPLELATLRGLREGRVEPENPFVFAGGAWVPWYTQHKVLAGLRDAWVIAGSAQAGEVALALADWVVAVTSPLSEADMQKMLSVEHGGMSAVLMDLYARTGETRYRRAAERFQHHAVLDPLRAGRDALVGLHANTQIPKITGAALSYEVTGAPDGRTIAETFWDTVTGRHSWVI